MTAVWESALYLLRTDREVLILHLVYTFVKPRILYICTLLEHDLFFQYP
jgi:hypothetical protein